MRANRPSYIISNMAIALIWAGVMWLLFGHLVHTAFFAIAFFWFYHTRATTERFEEINARVEMNTELLEMVLKKHPDFDLNELLENYDLDHDDIETS